MTTNKKQKGGCHASFFNQKDELPSFSHMLVKARCMKNVIEFEVRKHDPII